jgi:hypothetical protein
MEEKHTQLSTTVTLSVKKWETAFEGVKQMTTEERNEEEKEKDLRAMRTGAEALAAVHERIAPRFRRAEVRALISNFWKLVW